jgi:transposase
VHFKIKEIKGHKYLYLIKNQRINGEVKQVKQICVGTPQKVYDILTKKRELRVASYSFGKPAALMKAAQEVGLTDSLNNRINRKNIKGLTPAQYLLTILIGRAEHTLSRNRLNEYFKKSVLSFHWKPEYKLNSQNFLNYMEKLDENTIRKIENDVATRLVELGYKPTRLIFDTTNFYTHIQNCGELSRKSSSKEKRYDKNLIGLGMTISDDNIPFNSFTYPANQHDTKVFSNIIDEICDRLKRIKVPAKDITMVVDRGMLSENNVKNVLDNMHIVGSLPFSMVKNLFSIPMSEYETKWKNKSNNTIKAHRTSGDHYGTDLVLVIKYNEKSARKQKREWDRNKKKIFDKVKEIRKSLNRKGRGRKMTAKGLTNRIVDSIPKQYRGLFDYSAVKNDGKLELRFELLENEEHTFLTSLGKTVIFTDSASFSTREIVEIYASRNVIEEDYKWLKDKLLIPLKPMYVWKDRKIRAHVFLCVMGLLLYNYLLLKMNKPGLSLPRLSEDLEHIRLVLISEDAKHADFVIEDLNRDSAELLSKLDLSGYIPA